MDIKYALKCRAVGIDLTRMECKVGILSVSISPQVGIDLTRMECKDITILECKII